MAKKGKILVTGATGHLGNNLLRQLLDAGESVRVLVQRGIGEDSLEGLDVDLFYGDLRNPDDMMKAAEGIQRIYHTAAQISTVNGTEAAKRQIFATNVTGTRYLLEAAKKHGVERMVFTGSFSATGHRLDDPSASVDENEPFYPFHDHMPYARSKLLGEYECLKAVADGFDVVIATSCSIIGGHDYVPSRMGKTLCDFANGKLWAYVPGGFEFIRASDCARGHILAMEKGRKGQKYLLHTEFLTLDDLLTIFEAVTGRRRPVLRLPAPVLSAVAEVVQFVLTPFPRIPQRLTPGAIRILRMHRHLDITKAKEELGYEPTSMREAVQDAYDFFVARGKIKRPYRPVERVARAAI